MKRRPNESKIFFYGRGGCDGNLSETICGSGEGLMSGGFVESRPDAFHALILERKAGGVCAR
jgi:hypothetical protein